MTKMTIMEYIQSNPEAARTLRSRKIGYKRRRIIQDQLKELSSEKPAREFKQHLIRPWKIFEKPRRFTDLFKLILAQEFLPKMAFTQKPGVGGYFQIRMSASEPVAKEILKDFKEKRYKNAVIRYAMHWQAKTTGEGEEEQLVLTYNFCFAPPQPVNKKDEFLCFDGKYKPFTSLVYPFEITEVQAFLDLYAKRKEKQFDKS